MNQVETQDSTTKQLHYRTVLHTNEVMTVVEMCHNII